MPEITLIAHNIRSTHNVGSIFRTAEGFGVKKIILSGYTPYPSHNGDSRLPHIAQKIQSQIHKTALGAESLVPFEHYETLDAWFQDNNATSNPLTVIALEQNAKSHPIQEYQPDKAFALLLGEEVKGIELNYLKHCNHIIEIPMSGKKESFNVSVACGIALYALSFNSNAILANNGN